MPHMRPARRRWWRMSLRTSSVLPPTQSRRHVRQLPDARSTPVGSSAADGSAAREFDAEFTDVGWGVPADVPQSVMDEIAHRTPGFHSWQQDHWLYHCGDGCAFLGEVGRLELEGYPDALETLRLESASFGLHDQESRPSWRP